MQVISETFPKTASWLGMEQLKLTNQKKYTTTQNKHKKLKPGLVALDDIQPGNSAGLFSKEKVSKEVQE